MSSADPAAADAPDPSVLLAERRLRILGELTDIGMELARDVGRKSRAQADRAEAIAASGGEPAPEATPAKEFDAAEAFARISRAIRLTLTLEARTDETLRALRAGVEAKAETRRAETLHRAEADEERRHVERKKTVERLVLEVAEHEIGDVEEFDRIEEALDDRLCNDMAYDDLPSLPLRETVQRLCEELELPADFSKWDGEGWPPRGDFYRRKYSRFWQRGLNPHYADDPELGPQGAKLE